MAMKSVEESTNLVGSNKTMVNISHNKDISNETIDSNSTNDSSMSGEVGSSEGTISNVETIQQEEEMTKLKQKVEVWQKAVDNYLSTGQRRRKRRQAASWPQMFSSNPYATTGTKATSQSMATYASGLSDVVGEALKPAMELMTQGVDLLSDLYSSKLSRSFDSTTALSTSSKNDTAPADQFRNQLKQLQEKLGGLGQQLQRVFSGFQQLQIPFLDNIMSSGGLFPLASPPSAASDGNNINGKAKQYKRQV